MKRFQMGLSALASVLALTVAGGPVWAQAYPAKPIRFVVGPGPDALARAVRSNLPGSAESGLQRANAQMSRRGWKNPCFMEVPDTRSARDSFQENSGECYFPTIPR